MESLRTRRIYPLCLLLMLANIPIWGCKKQSASNAKAQKPTSKNAKPLSSKHLKSKKKDIFTIGILYWSMSIPGQVAMRKGLEQHAAKLNKKGMGFPKNKLIAYVAGDGPKGMERQIRQMNKLIQKKVDLIIVQPTDIAALSTSLKAANKAGIPVVAYDQYIIGGKLASYVTSNNYQAGYLDGEYIASKFDNKKAIKIILVEYPHVSSTVRRVDGFMDALRQAGQKYKIIKSYNAVEPKSGKIAGQKILKDFPKKGSIDVVFTVNDGGGLPVVRALTKAGRTEIKVATIDGDPESVKIIRKKGITVIDSAQFCGPLGAEALKTAYQILLGKKVPKHKLVPVFPITIETAGLYKSWMGPYPKKFRKSWKSKNPFWEAKIQVVKTAQK